jgi:hypothetical protein
MNDASRPDARRWIWWLGVCLSLSGCLIVLGPRSWRSDFSLWLTAILIIGGFILQIVSTPFERIQPGKLRALKWHMLAALALTAVISYLMLHAWPR